MTLNCDLTLDPWFSRSNFERVVTQELDDRLTWNKRDVSRKDVRPTLWFRTDGYEMMQKAWSSIEEVPYCFSRSSVKYQDHTGQKIFDFDPNLVFPDCNFILISQMAMQWYTNHEVAWKRYLIVFQGHPSNFKVTRDKKSPILTQIWYFRTATPFWIDRWQWNEA